MTEKIKKTIENLLKNLKIKKGANFCQVERVRIPNQLNLEKTDITHQCKGKAPNFKKILKKNKKLKKKKKNYYPILSP